MAGGRPPFYATIDDLENAIEGYFLTLEKVDKDGNPLPSKPPTVAGLAYALGFADRSSLYSQSGRGEEFSYVLKKTILYIESYHETALTESGHPTGSIFWLKNHGWADKQPDNSGDASTLRIVLESPDKIDMGNVEINIPDKPAQSS